VVSVLAPASVLTAITAGAEMLFRSVVNRQWLMEALFKTETLRKDRCSLMSTINTTEPLFLGRLSKHK